jgi:hypothetical protein
MRFCGP